MGLENSKLTDIAADLDELVGEGRRILRGVADGGRDWLWRESGGSGLSAGKSGPLESSGHKTE